MRPPRCRPRRRPLAALATLLAASLLGCFEEELTLELQPDGQGSLRLERTLSAALSRRIPDEERYGAHTLAEWRGVVAWSDVVVARQDGRVTLAATGWFRDANLLKRTTPRDGLKVTVTRGPGLLDVAILEDPGLSGERLLAAPDEESDRRLRARALAGFRRRMTLALPGEASRLRGLERVEDERERVTFARDSAQIRAEADALSSLAKGLQAEGAATKAGAESAARELGAKLLERTQHSVRCEVKPGAGSSLRFRRRLVAALEAWGSSPWALRVRAEREVLGEETADASLDPFEPNETDVTAAKLRVGPREGLLCSGEDWYRVRVSAGQELRVGLEFDHAEGDLDLELFGLDGASRSASQDDGESASLTVLERPTEVLVRVYGGWASYALTTRLTPAADADVHEPNDTFAAARRLAPARYLDLRCDGEDWYRVDVSEGGGLRVGLSSRPEAGDLDLALYGLDHRLLGASTGRAAAEVVTLEPGPARAVFVRVFGGNATYALTLDVTEEAPPK